jgi:hypothetical protein
LAFKTIILCLFLFDTYNLQVFLDELLPLRSITMNIKTEKANIIEQFKRVNDEKLKSAIADIQDITDWYNKQQEKLGNRFQKTTIK